MMDWAFLAYLVALLAVPLLVRWRWGLMASLVVTVLELGLVALVCYVLEVYRVFPNPYPVGRHTESPLTQIRRGQAFGYALIVMWVAFPVLAALIGGALSVAWSVVLAVRRSGADRG